MGIIWHLKSFFGGQTATAPRVTETEPPYKALEIKPAQDVFDCYAVVFDQVMSKVEGIPPEDLDAAKDYVMAGDGGFLNAHRYYDHVWTRYFSEHEWRWLEYDEWVQVFTDLGRFPIAFPRPVSNEKPSTRMLLDRLKVPELKLLCKQHSVNFKSKTTKSQLVEMLEFVPGIEQYPQLQTMDEMAASDAKRSLYTVLMRTTQFRAVSLHNRRKAQSVGVTKFEVLHTLEQDREFVELALRRKPDGLSPLYPGDISSVRSVIDLFDR